MTDHPNSTWDPSDSETTIEIATAITADDLVDASLRNARGYLRSHRQRTLFRGLAVIALAFGLGTLVARAVSREWPTLDDMLLVNASASVRETMLAWFVVWILFLTRSYLFHDRLIRRRSRRWAVREHGSEPMPVRYRFDAAGLTVTDAHGSAFRAWTSVTGQEEVERQFFLSDTAGGVAVVPKRDLSAADQDRLRAFLRHRLSDRARESGAATLPPEVTREAAVHLCFEQTVEDRAAASLMVWSMPAGRRRRALNAVAAALVVALGILGLDTLQWGLERRGEREPFGEAFVGFLRTEAAAFHWPALYAVGFGLGLWLMWPWFLRRQAMALARLRSDVPVDLALGPSGVAVAMPGTEFRYAWSGVRAVLEGYGHIGLLLPLSVVLPIPKQALDETRLATLRRFVAEHIGQEGGLDPVRR